MVAYNFHARFVEQIRAGSKRQTIRVRRKHDARPGDELQLYTGMRTRECALIAREFCASVTALSLVIGGHGIEQITVAGEPVDDLDAFAVADGFADAGDMADFWGVKHGEGEFPDLVLIRW
ncbi:MAG: hypothetical protein ABTQ30_15135 [Rhizobiaceae bacterium]